MMRFVAIVIILTCGLSSSRAGSIRKAYECLGIYNYFEAKRLFEKSLKSELVPAAYGLSIIYLRTDNPFHNLDSAYSFIVRAHGTFPYLEEKEKSKILEFGITQSALDNHREQVSGELFKRAIKENSIAGFDRFIQKNYWSIRIDSAVFFRDSLAFEYADKRGRSSDYAQFLNTYPTSDFVSSAQTRYDQTLYRESTASNTLISYVEFVNNNQNSPYRTDAEDKIFQLYTQTATTQSYEKFIEDNPTNHNVNDAWRKLYNSHVQSNSYDGSSLQEFTQQFPEYPFMDELIHEMEVANSTFYPIKRDHLWGFIDENGHEVIPPKYDETNEFAEGLAAVKIDSHYGYINKTGRLVINAVFDDALSFHEGHAVVEYKGKLGMINRNGEFIISPHYEDLGNLNNGLAYFLKDSLYGYFDSKGIERIPPKFSEAYDFENGKAIVSQNDYYGLIDVFGTTYIPMKYDELRAYQGDVYLALFDEYWGLISLKGDTILGFEYDYIGPFHCNRAIVEKNETFNYIDLNGKMLLEIWIPVYSEYRELAKFKSNYAKIQVDEKYNLIDTTGKKLFAQPKENIGDYSSLIACSKAGKWGYVNSLGVQVIPFNYTAAESFRVNSGIISLDPFYGLVNKSGQYLIQPYFEHLEYLNDSILIAKSKGNYGLLSASGDTLLNFVYIKIEPISDSIVRIEQGTEIIYYDFLRNRFLRKEEN